MRRLGHVRALRAGGLFLILGGCSTDLGTEGSVCASAANCESAFCMLGRCADPAADNDGDGLANEAELDAGLSPVRRDTDGDGAPDDAEV